jgi:RNA polymerase sigma factor (sigma-70 family)
LVAQAITLPVSNPVNGMALNMAFRTLDTVAAQLPFHLDDTLQANEAFRRWREHNDPHAHRTVQLWTYCYIRRYFTIKFLRDVTSTPTDVDELVTQAWDKVEQGHGTIHNVSRYASWVSVVCRRSFIDYLKAKQRRPSTTVLDEQRHEQADEVPEAPDPEIVPTVLACIQRLPDFLRQVTHLRLIDNLSYEEISLRTQRPVPSIRTFLSKALQRLRDDEQLRLLLDG